MMYIMMHNISKGLSVIVTAMVYIYALQLGGIHIYQLFLTPFKENLVPYQRIDLAISVLINLHKKLDFLPSLDIILFDGMG